MFYRILLNLITIIFCLNICSFVYAEERTKGQFKKTDFGFHLSYLGRSLNYQKALNYIAQDGITCVAAYEPFVKNLYKDRKKTIEIIKGILGNSFKLLLILSNYPYEENSSVEKELEKSESKVVRITKDRIKQMYAHSNRFPPSDVNRYGNYLEEFLNDLEDAKLLDRISFQIANEPDAEYYFWGDATDFDKIYSASYKILSQFNVPVQCCGLTTHFFTYLKNDPRKKGFAQFMRTHGGIGTKIPFSFNFYYYTEYGYNDFDKVSYSPFKGAIITEFNIYDNVTEGSREKIDVLNSEKALYYYAKLLSFAYKNDIKRIYFWRLMDHPDEPGRIGYFDINGNPKPSYAYFRKIYDLVKNGYTVKRTDQYIEIIGTNNILHVAFESHKVSVPKNKIVETSSRRDFSDGLKDKEWIIYTK